MLPPAISDLAGWWRVAPERDRLRLVGEFLDRWSEMKDAERSRALADEPPAVDVARVFGSFVTRVFTDAFQQIDGHVAPQWRGHLDEGLAIDIRPDIVWLRGNSPAAVIDVKYKAEKPEGYPDTDAYQALASATGSASPLHTSCTPRVKGSRRHMSSVAGTTITTHAVDLDLVAPADLVASLHSLADRIHVAAHWSAHPAD
jgi:5-methylcytosine-specific restriction enzyme subunit McrC